MYVQMMPRLEAERAIGRIDETAAGTGSMEERDQRSYRRALNRTAMGGREMVERANVATLAQIGIAVETVEGGEVGV